ncbi:MAG: rkpK1 [Micavibrio sp.]|nr:rkpK1 [Micavibrio sp.]
MRIAMIGTGYVGLVSGACFAEFGVTVTCVDKDKGKIERLLNGEIPIYEPGLDALVARQVEAGRLSFTTDIAAGLKGADAVFIAVGTPPRKFDRAADLSFVYQAARDVAAHMEGYTVIITKSTVPVGTAREVERIVRETRPDGEFDVCSNPEFLREGAAISDFMRPDRVVIGAESERAQEVMRSIYRPLYISETPIVFTSLETAELSKYAANAFLATKITFINEIANICEKVGANVQDVAKAMGLDGRIGSKFLHAGPGYGGSCFPKDTEALLRIGENCGAPQYIVEAVVKVNEERRRDMARRVIAACDGAVRGKKIAVLGISFKPNTDDIREAPSLYVVPLLQEAGAKISAYDPAAMEEAAKEMPNVTWCKDAYEAIEGADALVILTEWNEFRALDLDRAAGMMAGKVICDFRNIYKPEDVAKAGFRYTSIGRTDAGPQATAEKKRA